MIKHFYDNMKNHEGWFTFLDFYKDVATKLPNNFNIVEVGGWFGMSSSYLSVELHNLGKTGNFWVIDTWKGTPEEPEHKRIMSKYNTDDIYNLFLENLIDGGVYDLIKPIQDTSIEASKQFLDSSLDFVFLDGDHSYKAVKNDILYWLPKVKNNGIIGGDDIQWDSVKTAVSEVIPNYKLYGKAWYIPKLEINEEL